MQMTVNLFRDVWSFMIASDVDMGPDIDADVNVDVCMALLSLSRRAFLPTDASCIYT